MYQSKFKVNFRFHLILKFQFAHHLQIFLEDNLRIVLVLKRLNNSSKVHYSPVSIKNSVFWPNWQYKASTAEMAENRYS